MAFVVASTAVCELLRDPPRGARVVAAGPAAVYLEVPGAPAPGWVALLARDAVRVPIGMVTAVPRRQDPFAGVAVGASAHVGGGEVRLAAGPAFRPLRYWDPGAPRLGGALAAAPVVRRAEALALLAAGLPAAEVRQWADRAAPLEAALARAGAPATVTGPVDGPVDGSVDGPVDGSVDGSVEALVGLGPGLTPAGDDVLAGALVTLAAAGDEPRRGALRAAVGARLARTTPVSAVLLEQACRGRSVPQLGGLLRALAGSGDLDTALVRLSGVGHTSGAALALGVRAALRALAGRSLRRVA